MTARAAVVVAERQDAVEPKVAPELDQLRIQRAPQAPGQGLLHASGEPGSGQLRAQRGIDVARTRALLVVRCARAARRRERSTGCSRENENKGVMVFQVQHLFAARGS